MNTDNQLVRGATWMVSLRWVVRGLGFLRMVVLARLLAPEDFGVFAIALVVLGFIEFLSEGGVEFALIREHAADRSHFDSAWTMQIVLGLLTATLIFASAPLVADLFSEPRAVLVIQIIALRPAFNAFTNIGVVHFLKDFNFGKEFKFSIVRDLIDTATTVALALIIGNYLALVIGTVAGAALTTAFSYFIHPYRPRLSVTRIREIWSYSGWLVVLHAADEIGELIDRTVVGTIAASNVLGIYQMASMFGGVVMSSTISPLWRGLFPSYSRQATEPEKLAQSFYAVLGWVMVVSCVAGFGIASVAGDLVVVVLGEKWTSAAAFVPWLTLALTFASIAEAPLLVIVALGHTKLCAMQTLLRLAMLAAALPAAGIVWGVKGVAIAYLAVVVVHLFVPFYLLTRKTAVRWADIIQHSWRPVISGIIMFVVVTSVGEAIDASHAVALVAEIGVGAATYFVCTFLFWAICGRPDGPEATALDIVASRFRAESAD